LPTQLLQDVLLKSYKAVEECHDINEHIAIVSSSSTTPATSAASTSNNPLNVAILGDPPSFLEDDVKNETAGENDSENEVSTIKLPMKKAKIKKKIIMDNNS
jgi:hypothetical protein